MSLEAAINGLTPAERAAPAPSDLARALVDGGLNRAAQDAAADNMAALFGPPLDSEDSEDSGAPALDGFEYVGRARLTWRGLTLNPWVMRDGVFQPRESMGLAVLTFALMGGAKYQGSAEDAAAAVVDGFEYVNAKWWEADTRPAHPLKPLVLAWVKRGTVVEAKVLTPKQPGLFPAGLYALDAAADAKTLTLFSDVTPTGQLALPDVFPTLDAARAPLALPVHLFDLGVALSQGGPSAPLALRLFVDSLLRMDVADRGQPRTMRVKGSDLLERLYPNGAPRGGRWQHSLEAAANLINGAAWIPWSDASTGQAGKAHLVLVVDIPYTPDAELVVVGYLPPSAKRGPQVSPNLPMWGAKSARAYRLLLNLPVANWIPGRTFHPMGKRRPWAMSKDADDYPAFSDTDLVRMAYPSSADSNTRQLRKRAREALEDLAAAGEVVLLQTPDGLKALPPGTPT